MKGVWRGGTAISVMGLDNIRCSGNRNGTHKRNEVSEGLGFL